VFFDVLDDVRQREDLAAIERVVERGGKPVVLRGVDREAQVRIGISDIRRGALDAEELRMLLYIGGNVLTVIGLAVLSVGLLERLPFDDFDRRSERQSGERAQVRGRFQCDLDGHRRVLGIGKGIVARNADNIVSTEFNRGKVVAFENVVDRADEHPDVHRTGQIDKRRVFFSDTCRQDDRVHALYTLCAVDDVLHKRFAPQPEQSLPREAL